MNTEKLKNINLSAEMMTAGQISDFTEATYEHKGSFIHLSGDSNIGTLHLSGDLNVGSNELYAVQSGSTVFGTGNVMIAGNSIASGKDNVVGAFGFKVLDIVNVEFEGKNAFKMTLDYPPLEEFNQTHPKYSLDIAVPYTNVGTILSANVEEKFVIVDRFQYMRDETIGQLLYVDGYLNSGSPENKIGNFLDCSGIKNCIAGDYGHSEGAKNKSYGNYAHTEGKRNTASWGCHAEGANSEALKTCAHSEGRYNRAIGNYAHTDGVTNIAAHEATTAKGFMSYAKDQVSFVWNGKDLSGYRGKNYTIETINAYGLSCTESKLSEEEKLDAELRTMEYMQSEEILSDMYASHGKGTFNVNPQNGISGFYVGDDNLFEIIRDNSQRSGDVSREEFEAEVARARAKENELDDRLTYVRKEGFVLSNAISCSGGLCGNGYVTTFNNLNHSDPIVLNDEVGMIEFRTISKNSTNPYIVLSTDTMEIIDISETQKTIAGVLYEDKNWVNEISTVAIDCKKIKEQYPSARSIVVQFWNNSSRQPQDAGVSAYSLKIIDSISSVYSDINDNIFEISSKTTYDRPIEDMTEISFLTGNTLLADGKSEYHRSTLNEDAAFTDFIRLRPNCEFTYSTKVCSQPRAWYIYDGNDNSTNTMLSAFGGKGDGSDTRLCTYVNEKLNTDDIFANNILSAAKYIRFNYYSLSRGKAMDDDNFKITKLQKTFRNVNEEFDYVNDEMGENKNNIIKISNDIVEISSKIPTPSKDFMYGKTYTCLGDSYTNYGACDTYVKYIADRNNMTLKNIAVSGSKLYRPDGATWTVDCFMDRLYNASTIDALSTADYITIAYGCNDDSTSIGELTSSAPNTYLGAWNTMLSTILSVNPDVKIGIIINDGMIGGKKAVYDAIISAAEYWGIPYLDMLNDVKVPVMLNYNSNPGKANKLNPYAISQRRAIFDAQWDDVKEKTVNLPFNRRYIYITSGKKYDNTGNSMFFELSSIDHSKQELLLSTQANGSTYPVIVLSSQTEETDETESGIYLKNVCGTYGSIGVPISSAININDIKTLYPSAKSIIAQYYIDATKPKQIDTPSCLYHISPTGQSDHPGMIGHQFRSTIIENWMRSL